MAGGFLGDDTARNSGAGTGLTAGSDVTITESLLNSASNHFQGLRKLSRAGIIVLLNITAPAAAGTVVRLTWNSTPIQATLPALPIGCHKVQFDGLCTASTGIILFSISTSAMSGAITTSGGAATYSVGSAPTRPVVVNLGAGGAGTGYTAAMQNT